MEGLYRESVAADGDGDLPEAVQEQHLAAVLHGLFGACSRGYLFLSRCWCVSVGSVRGEKNTEKLVAFRAGYLCSWNWGIWVRVGGCGMWHVDRGRFPAIDGNRGRVQLESDTAS